MTQINLHSPFWKEAIKYLGWVLLFAVLWFRGCNRSGIPNSSVKLEVPEVKGKFVPKKPAHESASSKMERTATGKEILQVENPIDEKLIAENEKLKTDFAKANDSIKKLQFNKAIQLNKFSTNFEDENVILNIEGIVQGEVKEVTPGYTIKKKTIEVPIKQKETLLRVLAGGAVGVNKELNQVVYQLDLNFQNRKGDIISAEYLNVGGQAFGMVGFKKSILNIKR
jgi:hypothetical protein